MIWDTVVFSVFIMRWFRLKGDVSSTVGGENMNEGQEKGRTIGLNESDRPNYGLLWRIVATRIPVLRMFSAPNPDSWLGMKKATSVLATSYSTTGTITISYALWVVMRQTWVQWSPMLISSSRWLVL